MTKYYKKKSKKMSTHIETLKGIKESELSIERIETTMSLKRFWVEKKEECYKLPLVTLMAIYNLQNMK